MLRHKAFSVTVTELLNPHNPWYRSLPAEYVDWLRLHLLLGYEKWGLCCSPVSERGWTWPRTVLQWPPSPLPVCSRWWLQWHHQTGTPLGTRELSLGCGRRSLYPHAGVCGGRGASEWWQPWLCITFPPLGQQSVCSKRSSSRLTVVQSALTIVKLVITVVQSVLTVCHLYLVSASA